MHFNITRDVKNISLFRRSGHVGVKVRPTCHFEFSSPVIWRRRKGGPRKEIGATHSSFSDSNSVNRRLSCLRKGMRNEFESCLLLGMDRRNARVLFRERITALLALAQISRHRSPSVRVGKVSIIEHAIKLLIKCLRSDIRKTFSGDGRPSRCLTKPTESCCSPHT
jgi:hypothetical protein